MEVGKDIEERDRLPTLLDVSYYRTEGAERPLQETQQIAKGQFIDVLPPQEKSMIPLPKDSGTHLNYGNAVGEESRQDTSGADSHV